MKIAALAPALLAITAIAPANAAFTIENTNGGDGFVTVTDAQNFTLFGADNGRLFDVLGRDSLTTYGDRSGAIQSISFSWNYETADDPEMNLDPAGYFVNSDFFQLTPISLPFGGMTSGFSGGMQTVDLAAGDLFGFYVASLDGLGGRGSLSISLASPFVAAVPEPGTWAMMIVGFGMAGGALRYRRRSTKVAFATA